MTGQGRSYAQTHQATVQTRRHRQVELALTRGRATSWAKGIGAILAVGLAFGLIKGRSDITDLNQSAARAVGVLLLVAILAAVVAVYFLFRAAYGRLGTAPEGTADHTLALWTMSDLRTGLRWALGGTAALLCAVGVTWYAPAADGPQLQIVDTSGTSWCGEPMRTAAGILTLRVNGQEVQVDLVKAIQVLPVDSCPAP